MVVEPTQKATMNTKNTKKGGKKPKKSPRGGNTFKSPGPGATQNSRLGTAQKSVRPTSNKLDVTPRSQMGLNVPTSPSAS